MTPLTTLTLAFSMSVDAFAAAIGKGAALDRPRLAEALRTGVIFGSVEAVTPVIGWAAGLAASASVAAVDHWIAFALLALVGGRMLLAALRGQDDEEAPRRPQRRHGTAILLATAVGTSLDAMAVGVTLAFIGADIVVAALAIGLATALMATFGMLIGRFLGGRFGQVAEALGGVALIGLGCKILAEHTLFG
ncbi:manganese efflux pump MntP [Roseomonas sp. JC162]|uniref:Putative manganese efflux pump MntP n=1 Tax=Neoroseomonas marina TaxID=1232220 RepID=A0A848ECU9_9PROT|nr:manganese efflux pump MntP [Neoroseomonas marina]